MSLQRVILKYVFFCLSMLVTIGFGVAGDIQDLPPSCEKRLSSPSIVTSMSQFGDLHLEGGTVLRLADVVLDENGITSLAKFIGRPIRYFSLLERADRYGRISAYIAVNDIWIQAHFLASGEGRYHPDLGPRRKWKGCHMTFLAEILKSKEQGSVFSFLATDSALFDHDGRFAVVEGVVYSAQSFGRRIFINFSQDWKHDFTILMQKRTTKDLIDHIGSLDALVGQKVRVRGWIDLYNGPSIKVEHALQLDVLQD